MSLQIWLPFNGSLVNQGVYNSTITSTSPQYSTSGKIGKALSLASNGNYTVKTTYTQNNNEMSICFWVNPNNPGIWSDIFSFGGNNRMEVSSDDKKSYTWYVDSGKQGLISSGTYLFGLNLSTWSHVVIAIDTSSVYFYVNGVLTKTVGRLSTTLANIFAENAFFYVGARVGNSSCYAGLINDFRVYDECLSPKQVKEISKGLVCHYALDNNGSGMPNEIANSMPYTSVSGYSIAGTGWGAATLVNCDISPSGKAVRSTYSGDGGNSGGIHKQPYSYSSLENGEIYTFSLWIRASKSVPMNIYNEMMTSKTPAPPITIGTEWTFISVSGPVNTSASYHSDIAYCTGTNVTTGMWIEIFGLKLEKGNKATPWMPHTSDAEYSIFNINNNKEIDISGYGNHGTKSGAITYNSDTPRYSISTVFNGSNTFIACGRGGMVKDAITISSWVYADNWANINTIWSCTEGGGWSSGKDGSVYRFYMGTGTSSNTYKTVDAMALSSITTGWHLITGTYDGFNVKIYIDGVLKGTNAAYTTKTPIFYASSNGIFIGAEAGGNQTTPAGSYTACKISDFRIYATALSDANILELYKTSASIDNKGNILGYDFNE